MPYLASYSSYGGVSRRLLSVSQAVPRLFGPMRKTLILAWGGLITASNRLFSVHLTALRHHKLITLLPSFFFH